MKFIEMKIKYGQISKNNRAELIEVARDLVQERWNTSVDQYHFVISKIAYRYIHILCVDEVNDQDENAIKTVCTEFIEKFFIMAGIENVSVGEVKELIEISFDCFMDRLRQANQMYSNLRFDYSVLNIDYEQTILPEKLFDNEIEPKGSKLSFIPEDEIMRIRYTEAVSDDVDRPVHYIVYSDSRNAIDEIDEDLICRLRKYKRITSRRYLEISRDDITTLAQNEYRIANLNNLSGGLVIVNLDDTTDDDFEVLVNSVYSEPAKYKGKYTVIFNLCEMDGLRKREIKRICDFWPFVEISDCNIERSKAIKILDQIAEENEVVLVDSYYDEILQAGENYTRDKLVGAFRKWYLNKYSISKNYPAYTTYIVSFSARDTLRCPAYYELESLIGLKSVKSLCKDIISFYQMEKLRKEQYSSINVIGMHMVFQGNPGTAKTTVARIMAKIFKETGILSNGDLIEVGRADLVEKYVGQTAPNVKNYFKKAKGNVLFIDEAYSLADNEGSGNFGIEAINTIVQEMENNREDVVVIFAGYKKEMKEFLHKNSGLSSRISFYVDFPDYSDDELFVLSGQDFGGCDD